MVLFVCLFFSFDHGIVCLSFLFAMVKRKEKTNKQYHGQEKRKEKTDKQCHGQKKRKDKQTIPWSKEKKRQTNNTMVKSKDFDHGIVCLSFLFF
jgi:Flp pilus assembly protein TadB